LKELIQNTLFSNAKNKSKRNDQREIGVGENSKAAVNAEVILINKVSGYFGEIGLHTDKSEDTTDYDGTCSLGK
jgi:hypothetical protein